MEKQIRELKVGYQPRPTKGYYPYIGLGGKWPRQAGIVICQKVKVRVYRGED